MKKKKKKGRVLSLALCPCSLTTMTSARPMALNTISNSTSFLGSWRLMCLAAWSLSLYGCLIGILNWTCPKQKSSFSAQVCSFQPFSTLVTWYHHFPCCQTKHLMILLDCCISVVPSARPISSPFMIYPDSHSFSLRLPWLPSSKPL